jgi:hypothetical protein
MEGHHSRMVKKSNARGYGAISNMCSHAPRLHSDWSRGLWCALKPKAVRFFSQPGTPATPPHEGYEGRHPPSIREEE